MSSSLDYLVKDWVEFLREDLGISKKEAEYIAKTPCLIGLESCSWWKGWLKDLEPILSPSVERKLKRYLVEEYCLGCIDFNGLYVIKTGPDQKPREVEKRMRILKERCPYLYRFVKKRYNL